MGRSYGRRKGRPVREYRPFRVSEPSQRDKVERERLTGWKKPVKWVWQGERQVAPCGKLAHDQREAEARARLSLGNDHGPVELEAYPCRDGGCREAGLWHVRSAAKAKRKSAAKNRRYKHRRRLRAEVPLHVWDDEGGGSPATWLATGQLRQGEG